MKANFKFIIKSGISALLLILLSPFGQLQAQETSGDSDELGLEEVIVTARRKVENLQDVPASVQAFSAQVLEDFRISDLADLAFRMPGVVYNPSGLTEPQIYMRGIGNSIQSGGADGAVGFFINGVYLSRNAGSIVDLYDLQQVEVVKGAQSLRFGKSVSGGVINYITKQPTNEFQGSVEATIGDYNRVDIAGSAYGPISDTVLFGISAISRGHDYYGENTLGGGEEDEDRSSVRGELLFDVNEQLDISLSGDYTRLRGGGKWYDIGVAGDSYAVTYNSFFAPPIPGLPGFVLPNRNQPFVEGDERSGRKNFNGDVKADMWGTTLRFDYTTASEMVFSSITDYRDTQTTAFEERCGMYWDFPMKPIPGTNLTIPDISSIYSQSVYEYLDQVPDCWFSTDQHDDVKQFSQEFRLSATGDTIDWSVGFYYLKEKIDRGEITAFLFPDFALITEYAFAMAFGGEPSGEDLTEGLSFSQTKNDAKNLGIFGEFTWHINDDFDLNAGLRYAKDKKDFTALRGGDSFDSPIEGGSFVANRNASWDAWLPSVTLIWNNTDSVSTYLGYARGYKPGGFSGQNAGDPDTAVFPYEPEYSDNYELGVNSMLADNRIRLNATSFYSKFKDLQTDQFIQVDPERPPDFVTANAGKTVSYGLELNFEALITENLNFQANYAYTHCTFEGELIIDSNGTDIDGNECRRTPRNAYNLVLNWEQPVSNNLEVFLGANYSWSQEYYWDNLNTPILEIPNQINLDLRAGINSSDGRWVLTGWMKNATDELIPINAFELFGTLYYKYSAPRTYGVTFRYNFY